MNTNSNGMVKINENVITGATVPTGFIVRERIVDGKGYSLEYGVYLSNEIFLGVPLHYSVKDKLLPTGMNTEDCNYYYLPQESQFAVASYKSKKTNKTNPLLVEPSEKKKAVLISSLAFGNGTDTIIDVKIKDDSQVLRKYIDKERKMVGLIMVNSNTDVINPSTTVEITYGKIGANEVNTKTFKFGNTIPGGVEMSTMGEYVDIPGGAKTAFINLPMVYDYKNNKKTEDR